MLEELSKYQGSAPCETCGGARLRSEPLAVKIAGEDISMSTRRSVRHAYAWFSTLEAKLTPQQQEIARAILKEINERLGSLNNVGLDSLTLDRTSATLSGGDSPRIRLATPLGPGLSGVRSDERRLGKECARPCGSRWARTPTKTKKHK